MIFRLIESYLVEDIAAVKKQYSHVPEEDFDRIIRLDPTFDENRDSVGKYGKWLLGLYKKDNPLNSDIDISKMLSLYDATVKDRAKKIEKDTGKFRSLSDMETAIENAGEAELSDRQKLRQRQANKDYDLVFENDDWAIFVPNTWEADVNLGKGTSWCTADSREEFGKKYYDNYLSHGGKYYVIMNKHDKSEKYQFHFETEQFMDKHDDEIDVGEFCNENGLSEFFEKEGYEVSDYHNLEQIIIDIYNDINGGETLYLTELQTLGNIYGDELGVYDLLSLYDFVNSDCSMEDVYNDSDGYLDAFYNACGYVGLEVSEEANVEYIYNALVQTIDNYCYDAFYLEDLVGEEPISDLPIIVNGDKIISNIRRDDIEVVVRDEVEGDDVRDFDDFVKVARGYLESRNHHIPDNISDDFICILFINHLMRGTMVSYIDIPYILEMYVNECLRNEVSEFLDYYYIEMRRHGEIPENVDETYKEEILNKLFQFQEE